MLWVSSTILLAQGGKDDSLRCRSASRLTSRHLMQIPLADVSLATNLKLNFLKAKSEYALLYDSL